MAEATFVLFARADQRSALRQLLQASAQDAVTWRERRRLFGSEFYVSGPSTQAREAHLAAASWLSRAERG